jgi:hypothetical protein
MVDYYDPRVGLGSAYKFYKTQDKYTYKQIKEMLDKKEAFQLNKQGTKTAFFPIVGHGMYSYQGDIMFPDEYNGYTGILCIINVITRVAYCYALKNKTQEEVYDKFIQFFRDLNGLPIEHLQTDNGKEFTNKKLRALLNSENIDFYTVDPGDHFSQGIVERFNETLRRLITIYESAYKTRDWVSVLPDLVYNYNHRYHTTLKCAPIDANEVDQFDKELQRYGAAEKQFAMFSVGDRVRVLIPKQKFDKGRKVWSNEIYKIDEIKGHRLLVDGSWRKHYELQKIGAVHKKLFDNNEAIDKEAIVKEKKVVRDLRKEGVSNENVIENKRERRIKFDGSLVGKRYDMGGGEIGTIKKYEADNGEYKWFVKFDKKAKLDKDWVNEEEIKKYLVR